MHYDAELHGYVIVQEILHPTRLGEVITTRMFVPDEGIAGMKSTPYKRYNG